MLFRLFLEMWLCKLNNYLIPTFQFSISLTCTAFCMEIIFKAVLNSHLVLAEFFPTTPSGQLDSIGMAGILMYLCVFLRDGNCFRKTQWNQNNVFIVHS